MQISLLSIKALRHIRPVLTCDSQSYRYDFANSVLTGTSDSNINKLQCVQNCLARVVLQDNYNSATSLLSEFHWLPVNKRINFKIATLVYQSLAFGHVIVIILKCYYIVMGDLLKTKMIRFDSVPQTIRFSTTNFTLFDKFAYFC